MTGELHVSAQDRVLVLAPHPDDETLAAGDLIRASLAAKAALRVVFATDGDNNPWPQRWIEKRWRIGPNERLRWGARRRREALAALAQLGLDEPEAAACFLGWPDQGLTALLMRDEAAVERLATEIEGFAPTHLVVPVLDDRHPDHSALHVMAELALLRSGHRCLRLGYVVHGNEGGRAGHVLVTARRDPAAKQRAMEAHASQLVLSRKRLLGIAARPNRFEVVDVHPLPEGQRELRLARSASSRGHDLLLVLGVRGDLVQWRVPVPRRNGSATPVDARGRRYAVEFRADEVRILLPALPVPPALVFAKLHRRDPRTLIFDEQRWKAGADLLPPEMEALRDIATMG